jgi:hypothetical protein
MNVRGTCHCGEVQYEASVDPERVTICHCTDCQRLTGSAYRVTVRADASGFRLLKGSPKFYVKTADSGARRTHAFCGTCGSPMYAHKSEGPISSYGLRVGSIEQRAQLVPRKQIWCRSALDWSSDLTALPGTERE